MSTMRLIQMASAAKGDVHLHKFDFSEDWNCTAEGKHDGMAYKVTGTGDTPDNAIIACWTRWCKITDALPELIGRLPPPAEDAHDGDAMIEPVDASIPF